MPWRNAQHPPPLAPPYTCGYCGSTGGPREIFTATQANGNSDPGRLILVCGSCDSPTAMLGDKQYPGAAFGEPVKGLPPDIQALYDEARGDMAVPAYTSAVLVCRKILMHVAVELDAEPNLKFIEYVDYLSENHHVPVNAKGWVDHIRSKSNEANHEIVQMSREEAEQLISFTEVLLKLVYELPQRVPGVTP